MTTSSPAGAAALKKRMRRFHAEALGLRIPWRHRFGYWRHYLRLARKGKLVHSSTRDAVYEDGPLLRAYERARQRIEQRLARAPAARGFVEVPSFDRDALDLESCHRLMDAQVPFVIRGGAEHLPLRRWTLDHLEAIAGDCEVPINEAADEPEADRSRPSKAHRYYRFRRGQLREVTQAIRTGGKARISTAEDVMHHAGGRLREDLDLPYWEELSGWAKNRDRWLHSKILAGKVVGAQLLMQPPGAFTLWHAEPGDNFFVLAKGTKTWTMAHPYYTAGMQPRVKTTTNYHGCNIDVREGDEVQRERGFVGYLAIPKLRFEMGPGDVLRVPNHWWHTVETAPGDDTIAATIRSGGLPNRTGVGYTILRWMDREYFRMAADFAKEGRIRDTHIGFPRPPRAAAGEEAEAKGAEQAP